MSFLSLLVELTGEMIHMILINASHIGALRYFFRGSFGKRRK